MAQLDEPWLLERWFLILTNNCLVVIPMYDLLLSQESVYWYITFEQNKIGRGYPRLKYENILLVW